MKYPKKKKKTIDVAIKHSTNKRNKTVKFLRKREIFTGKGAAWKKFIVIRGRIPSLPIITPNHARTTTTTDN